MPSPYTLPAAAGSFPFAIADLPTISTTGGVTAAAGSYPLAGQIAILKPFRLPAASGSFPLNGAASLRDFSYPVASGALPLSGKDAGLVSPANLHVLTATARFFSVLGQSASLLKNYRLIAVGGALPLSGKSINLRYGAFLLSGLARNFPLTGGSVQFTFVGAQPVVARSLGFRAPIKQVDHHIRHTGDDYGEAMLDLLPQGQAWPRDVERDVSKTVFGLCQIFGVVDGKAGDLLEIETDPRLTTEMLPDWERNFGLPDICRPLPPTTEQGRRSDLVARMTLLGDQSRAFFLGQAAALGETVTIKEYAPYMCGYSRVGYTKGYYDGVQYRWELGPPEMRMSWTVAITHVLTGVECTFRRYKPAHTELIFRYTSAIDRAASLYVFLGV